MWRFNPPDTTPSDGADRAAERPSRRTVLGNLGMVALAGIAGCSNAEQSSGPSGSVGSDTTQSPTTTTRETEPLASESPTTEAGEAHLDTARSALDAAFTEIYSVDLVNYEEKVWTPRFEDLGNMDTEVVDTHVSTARDALVEASDEVERESEQAVRVELLRHVASIAEHGSTFYWQFASAFEKVYQYEFLIYERGDYERAVEKMGVARELLAKWKPLGRKLTEDVKAILQLYDEHESVEAQVPSFDVGRWNYTTFGVEEYAYRLEPRLVGFEAYAESIAADYTGLDHLDAEEWQAAQDAFSTARTKIQQAGVQFSEADSRGGSFFDARARVFENRVPMFDDGFLLHLRAANEFVRGNVEKAKDLRFEGTTLILNAFEKYELETDETETPVAS